MPKRRAVCSATVAGLLVAIGAACAPVKPLAPDGLPFPTHNGVVLWGDSFAEQVGPVLGYTTRALGGSAPCSWLGDVGRYAALNPPRAAVLLFSGHTYASCTGGSLDTYGPDLQLIIDALTAVGTHVVAVAAPCQRSGTNPAHTHYPPTVRWEPYNSVCFGDVYHPEYRTEDAHLNGIGIARYVHEIRALVGTDE